MNVPPCLIYVSQQGYEVTRTMFVYTPSGLVLAHRGDVLVMTDRDLYVLVVPKIKVAKA